MKGPVPVIPVLKPYHEELTILPGLQLASDDIPWDPHTLFGNELEIHHSYFDCDNNCKISDIMVEMQRMVDNYEISTLRANSKDGNCSTTHLAKLWGIFIKAANQTITATSQLSKRDMKTNISRRV